MRIQTQSVHFDADAKLLNFISKKMKKLEKFHNRITSADVILKLENPSAKVQEKVAEIILNVPGSTIVAKEKSKLFEESVDSAIESLKRQLLKYKSKTTIA